MNKLFSILVFVAALFLQGCATDGGTRNEYQVNSRGEAVLVTQDGSSGVNRSGTCADGQIWSTARHLCMVPTETKFLYIDLSTGYMEVDLNSCGRPGVFSVILQAILTAVIQGVAVKAIENPYAAYGVAGIANSFVGAVSQNHLGKKCLVPAQLADANNFSELVRKNLIREQLKLQQEQVELENQVRQEMGLQSPAVSQQLQSQLYSQAGCESYIEQEYAGKGGLAWARSTCRPGQSFGPMVQNGQPGCGCR